MAEVVDLKLDSSNDLVVTNGVLQTVEDIDAVTQHVQILLQHFVGEWFLDEDFGIDYFGELFTKSLPRPIPYDPALIESSLRDKIQALDHLRTVQELEADFVAATRQFSIDLRADTDFGDIKVQVVT